MPEYLAPGVYVEEVSYRSKSIEGVSTTTTAFVGPTRYGPVQEEPDILTSLLDFERTYGDRGQLRFASKASFTDGSDTSHVEALDPMDNYMWHAVRAFFENGGARLYVKRIFRPLMGRDDQSRLPGSPGYEETPEESGGRASAILSGASSPPAPSKELNLLARFPGEAGQRRVRLTLRRTQNVLSRTGGAQARLVVNGLQPLDVVYIAALAPPSPPAPSVPAGGFYLAKATLDPQGSPTWAFDGPLGGPPADLDLSDLADSDGTPNSEVRIVTVSVTDMPSEENAIPVVWQNLPLDPGHVRAGSPDSLLAKFAELPANRADALNLPIIVRSTGVEDGMDVLEVLFDYDRSLTKPPGSQFLEDLLKQDDSTDLDRSLDIPLPGGNDGRRPTATEYEGEADPNQPFKTGLVALEDIEDISIIAAPGSTLGLEGDYKLDAATITSLLVGHAERMRYRIAVLDSGNGQTISQVRAMRATIDSKYAAFYYPWVKVLDPVTQREIVLPPSGFVSGIYARNDRERAVFKAPANEVVTLALGFETTLNKSQQDVLNPEGINCFRFFEGRGNRLWGARTATSDAEWKYVNLRRYFAYLEHSIDRGTQWAVFEPNGEALWGNVRRTIEDFLFNEFQMGALLGEKPEKAYFVKCDRSTMTQTDFDNGRLVVLIGVAPLRPAEFVIFRIGQWTGDRKV